MAPRRSDDERLVASVLVPSRRGGCVVAGSRRKVDPAALHRLLYARCNRRSELTINCTALAAELGLSKGRLSEHVRVLRGSGRLHPLFAGRSRVVRYRVTPP